MPPVNHAVSTAVAPPECTGNVTRKAALRWGSMVLIGAPLSVMLIGNASVLIGNEVAARAGLALPGWVSAAGFGASFVAGWLTWSVFTPRWRIWAMRNCAEWPSVREAAVRGLMLWPAGWIFERTEIMSLAQRQEIRDLESAWAGKQTIKIS